MVQKYQNKISLNIKVNISPKKQKQIFIIASLILAAFLQLYSDAFFYLKPIMLQQPWRFITAHWVHVGWIHYLINSFALVCLPFIFPNFRLKWLVISSISLPILLSLIFYFYYPQLNAYAGFSGALHGIYVLAACIALHSHLERIFAIVVLLSLGLKLVWEANINVGSSLTAQLIGSPVLIEAHQLGALSAIVLYVVIYFLKCDLHQID